MILHPGVLALLLGSALAAALVTAAAALGVRILRGWDPGSGSERQLALERLGHLVASLTGWALGFHLVSALLFVAVAEGIHPLFAGAMCATGSLNANPVGWWVLPVKGAGAALAALWLALHRIDARTDAIPLLRPRYALLLAIAPLVLADAALQAAYFLGLDPAVITSCCGSLFAEGGDSVASTVASLPPGPAAKAFFGTAALLLASLAAAAASRSAAARVVLAAVALAFLPVALAAVVAIVAPHYYQLPAHHCPFDLFQGAYRFVGYPLHGSLFAGVSLAALPGLLVTLRRDPALRAILERRERRWLAGAAVCILLFMTLATYPLLGPLDLAP